MLVLASIIVCRRKRGHMTEVEATRVNPPDAEWARLSDPEDNSSRHASSGGATTPILSRTAEQDRNQMSEKRSGPVAGNDDEHSPAGAQVQSTSRSPASVEDDASLSRAPTFYTVDHVHTPPPFYDSEFEEKQKQLFQLLHPDGVRPLPLVLPVNSGS